ncbi:MarR family winged helix-turn-helix transcriptional regulator [Micromonospora sp. KLBMP9576]|uniref:MarR family winged helix-turn-helix transcriptional regulator n=1 Tax=Micromonospora sp. KLBMP9576 TaxID=3424769 RepID=UPI003D8A1C4B
MAQPTVPSAPPDPTSRAALTEDVVGRITHLASALRHHQSEEIAALGLTPATARALHELDPDRPLPARDLAEALGCDRSNVTALVDKLERAGLVERRTDPTDRRQKTLRVTGPGRRVRSRVRQVMSDSRLLAGLTDQELAVLRELVWKVSDGGCPDRCDDD